MDLANRAILFDTCESRFAFRVSGLAAVVANAPMNSLRIGRPVRARTIIVSQESEKERRDRDRKREAEASHACEL